MQSDSCPKERFKLFARESGAARRNRIVRRAGRIYNHDKGAVFILELLKNLALPEDCLWAET